MKPLALLLISSCLGPLAVDGGVIDAAVSSQDAGVVDLDAPAGEAADSGPADSGVVDSGLVDGPVGYDFNRFRSDVQAAAAQAGSSANCAVALPASTAGNRAELHEAVRRAIAAVVLESNVITDELHDCGADGAACSAVFQRDIFISDGALGASLLAPAQTVERDANTIEEVIWSPTMGMVPLAPVVTIAGIRDGKVLGIAFFNGRTRCDL